eukprot:6199156-Pleurochrysis_carterae.AAC.4
MAKFLRRADPLISVEHTHLQASFVDAESVNYSRKAALQPRRANWLERLEMHLVCRQPRASKHV